MQVVYIAGGAGFIGSNLCEYLLDRDYHIVCIDNFITGNKRNIEEFLSHPNFQFFEADVIGISTDVIQELPKANFIFHLASPASPNKNSPRSYINFPIETLLANSQGTKNLLDIAKEMEARFLFASTSEVYGDPAVSPQPETYWGNVNPNGIRSVYDESKRYGEAITMAYVRRFGLDARIVRIFNTYGPKMQVDDGRVVSNFINQAIRNKDLTIYGDGNQTRSFCYIDDMVEGLSLYMFTDKLEGEVVNMGNPIETPIKEFAETVKQLTSTYSQIVFEALPEDDPKQRCPSTDKAKRLLGWEPKVHLEDGIRKTIEYFKSL